MKCQYHPIYRNCRVCGKPMERDVVRNCVLSPSPPPPVPVISERTKALREARAVIHEHAKMTWNAGLTERSDGITDVLVDFDLKFPEARE